MAMELVPGEDLAARLERGALPVSEALALCRGVAEGLVTIAVVTWKPHSYAPARDHRV